MTNLSINTLILEKNELKAQNRRFLEILNTYADLSFEDMTEFCETIISNRRYIHEINDKIRSIKYVHQCSCGTKLTAKDRYVYRSKVMCESCYFTLREYEYGSNQLNEFR